MLQTGYDFILLIICYIFYFKYYFVIAIISTLHGFTVYCTFC